MGAAVSRDAGARGARRGTRLRGGASLAALLAAGALLAGCGTAVPEAADAEGPGPAAVAIPAPAEPEQDGAAADDAAGNASGIVTTADDRGEGDQGTAGESRGEKSDGRGEDDGQGQVGDDQGEDAPGPSAADLPASWAGTYSAESLPLGGGYLVVQNLYGEHRGATSLEASDIAGQEYFASSGATCEGAATLAGDTADCVLPDDGRGMGEQTAVVHLVPAAFGATSLLVEVGVTDGLAVAEAPQGIGGLSAAVPSEVTLEEIEGAMVTAVMMADSPEGPLPEELDVRCELRDGGRHALCEIVGTPDGGGDGSWYGTLQPGYGNYVVLATKLPA
ncbi:hypothetical protein BCONGLO52_07210 [Brachybacterium conglomeratum]|uniref:Uncharacterized protein n=2 Tax=Brachybacterium TaxID=43668 RepID=A0A426SHJ2_9MICO|nr:hypothetical protein DS079_13490 [Brachybacterium paraconglomeratum]GLI29880.1 hypothetical protein BCONGLO52_07210 [Brachybacterium conglomeratum]GLK05943.1 hypothetical protein GCM10017597_27430 [Brachybacterium conglomeratum]